MTKSIPVIAYQNRIGPDILVGAFALRGGNHVMVAQARVGAKQQELARYYFTKLGLVADSSEEALAFAHALRDRNWRQQMRPSCWISEVRA